MRQYKVNKKEVYEIDRIICNKCGKVIAVVGGVPQEDSLQITKRWGYFSRKDNQEDCFDLCEDCYDELVASFKIQL